MGRHVYNLPVLLAGTIIISSEEGETEGTHVLVHYDNITIFIYFSRPLCWKVFLLTATTEGTCYSLMNQQEACLMS